MKKVIETDEEYKFVCEDSREATDLRDKLRDGGFYSRIPDGNADWVVVVTKESPNYVFYREWILIPGHKHIDHATNITMSQAVAMLRRVLDQKRYNTQDPLIYEDIEFLLSKQ
jgi:hypothetical protein